MTVEAVVQATEGFPDPREAVTMFPRARGNIRTAVQELPGRGYGPLDEMNPEAGRAALWVLIKELDLGEEGPFDYVWFLQVDLENTRGRGFEEFAEFAGNRPFSRELAELYAEGKRLRLRETAFRFFCYHTMGYTIRWFP